jgi:hypothetical protein
MHVTSKRIHDVVEVAKLSGVAINRDNGRTASGECPHRGWAVAARGSRNYRAASVQ